MNLLLKERRNITLWSWLLLKIDLCPVYLSPQPCADMKVLVIVDTKDLLAPLLLAPLLTSFIRSSPKSPSIHTAQALFCADGPIHAKGMSAEAVGMISPTFSIGLSMEIDHLHKDLVTLLPSF